MHCSDGDLEKSQTNSRLQYQFRHSEQETCLLNKSSTKTGDQLKWWKRSRGKVPTAFSIFDSYLLCATKRDREDTKSEMNKRGTLRNASFTRGSARQFIVFSAPHTAYWNNKFLQLITKKYWIIPKLLKTGSKGTFLLWLANPFFQMEMNKSGILFTSNQ